jgi:hypothetical protein
VEALNKNARQAPEGVSSESPDQIAAAVPEWRPAGRRYVDEARARVRKLIEERERAARREALEEAWQVIDDERDGLAKCPRDYADGMKEAQELIRALLADQPPASGTQGEGE